MASNVINLFVLISGGVILANLIANGNIKGTNTLFCGVANLWKIGVSGMLGQQATVTNC